MGLAVGEGWWGEAESLILGQPKSHLFSEAATGGVV